MGQDDLNPAPSLPGGAAFADAASHRRTIVLIALAIAAATAVCYWQIGRHGFVHYDDGEYIFQNPRVMEGLSWDGVKWAFTSFHASNWHPLTWLSHMLDVEMFGGDAGRHHLVSLAIHILNAMLLLWLLVRTTGRLWPSAFVAALFALHPLRVESVAWAAQRKDVLSTFFWFATMLAYAHYAVKPRLTRYAAVIILFALGLLSKPMFVTLPLVLFLFDYWPLGRLDLLSENGKLNLWTANGRRLVLEKIPLFAMTAASCILTLMAQTAAIAELAELGFWTRFANAAISYGRYIWMMFWPANLAVLYPLHTKISLFKFAAAVSLLVAVTVLVFRYGSRRRYLPVGWLWYVVTLVPVIGLVQVGSQSHADRYTYVPLTGIFIIIAWGVADLIRGKPCLQKAAVPAAIVILAVLAALTYRQAQFWKNDLTLFTRAVTVNPNNPIMLTNVAVILHDSGYSEDALMLQRHAAKIQPDNTYILVNLGFLLAGQGLHDEAIAAYQRAVDIKPDAWDALIGVAGSLAKLGRPDEAWPHLNRALELAPESPDVHNAHGIVLAASGRLDESIEAFIKAAETPPGIASARLNLARIYDFQGRLDDAIDECRKSIAMLPHYAAYDFLAYLLEKSGRLAEAEDACRRGLALFPENQTLTHRLTRLLEHRQPEKK